MKVEGTFRFGRSIAAAGALSAAGSLALFLSARWGFGVAAPLFAAGFAALSGLCTLRACRTGREILSFPSFSSAPAGAVARAAGYCYGRCAPLRRFVDLFPPRLPEGAGDRELFRRYLEGKALCAEAMRQRALACLLCAWNSFLFFGALCEGMRRYFGG